MENNHSNSQLYWDETSEEYQDITRISIDDFHYGPLLPGDSIVGELPQIKEGMKCLELGAGAGQNSIYLASKGADCLVTDISSEQLTHGELRKSHVSVSFSGFKPQRGINLYGQPVDALGCLPIAPAPARGIK